MADIGARWEQPLNLQERAALLAAWARQEIFPSGGLFTTGMGGFRVSDRIEPFLSQVVDRQHEATRVLGHLLDSHPQEAPWVLAYLSQNAVTAARERQKAGRIAAHAQAKQMIAAMLDYSASLGPLVDQLNRSVIQHLQTNALLPAVNEGVPGDALIRWLVDCAALAANETPIINSGAAPTEVVRLLIESIRVGHLHDALRTPPAVPPHPVGPANEHNNCQLVATGEVDQIESDLIALADLTDLWYESELCEQFSFMDDVLEHTSALLETECDEDQLPGKSWVSHQVHVLDVPLFCAELRSRVQQLAREIGASSIKNDEDVE